VYESLSCPFAFKLREQHAALVGDAERQQERKRKKEVATDQKETAIAKHSSPVSCEL
jgi:hypothetical protein